MRLLPTPTACKIRALGVPKCVIRQESIILKKGRGLFYVRECGTMYCCSLIICISPFQVPFSATMSPVRLHSSNPNLCADIEFQTPPSHLTDPLESSTDYTKLQEEFCLIAQKGNNKYHVPFREAPFFDARLPFTLLSLSRGHGRKIKCFIIYLEFCIQNTTGYDACLLGEHTS